MPSFVLGEGLKDWSIFSVRKDGCWYCSMQVKLSVDDSYYLIYNKKRIGNGLRKRFAWVFPRMAKGSQRTSFCNVISMDSLSQQFIGLGFFCCTAILCLGILSEFMIDTEHHTCSFTCYDDVLSSGGRL